jgi:hypothetical protein
MTSNILIGIPVTAVEHLFSPVCDETIIRLQRLRVLSQKGNVRTSGIKALCIAYGANLYDNFCESGEDVVTYSSNLTELFVNGDMAGAYLYLCYMYGVMDELVPEPIQWIASHKAALSQFLKEFVVLQYEYLLDDGLASEDADDELEV